MIAGVLSQISWEWHRLRRRRMPWVLLTLTVLLALLGPWLLYAQLRSGQSVFVNGAQPGSVTILTTVRFVEMLAFPNSLTTAVTNASGWFGSIVVMLLAASVIASKDRPGAVGAAPTRGPGRWPLLASKLLLLAGMSVAVLIVAVASAAVSSAIALSTLSAGWVSSSADWFGLAIGFGKSIYGMLPYIALATFAAVLTSSSVAAIGVSLGYYFVEYILTVVVESVLGIVMGLSVMAGPFAWFERVADFILGRAVSGWLQGWASAAIFPFAKLPDPTQSFFVVLAYVVVLLGAAFWIFQRRDIAGAKGE